MVTHEWSHITLISDSIFNDIEQYAFPKEQFDMVVHLHLFTIKTFACHPTNCDSINDVELFFAHQIGIYVIFNPCEIVLSHIPTHTRSSDPYVSSLSEKSVPYRYRCEISVTNTR